MKNWPWHTINGFIWCLVGVQAGFSFAGWHMPPHWWEYLLAAVGGMCGNAFHDKLSAEYLARKSGK